MPHLSGAEWPIVRIALVTQARRFYSQTHAWRESCAPLYTVKGVADYDILDVKDTSVIALRDVFVGQRRLCHELTPVEYRRERVRRPEGCPEAAAWIEDRLWLLPVPLQTGELIQATAILQPARQCKGLPQELFDLHIDAIVYGARAFLHESPGKPYSDSTLAGYFRGLFEQSFGQFRDRADTGGADVVRRTVPQFL